MQMLTGKTVGLLATAAAVLFALSASGQDSGYWQDGPPWLGAIGWFGFLICLLLLVVVALGAMVQRMRHHGGHGQTN